MNKEFDPNLGRVFSFQVGQVVGAVSARVEEKSTKPPQRYTQDALIEDMLAAHKFAQSDADREILKKTEGLGTSRTREPTITNLINRKFLESKRRGKLHEIISTQPARALISVLPKSLVDVVVTAKWEAGLAMVQRGEVSSALFMEKLRQSVAGIVEEAKTTGRVDLGIAPPEQKTPPNHLLKPSRNSVVGAKSR